MEFKSILFVCLGNICRSPIAEAVAKMEIDRRDLELTVESRGTSDWHSGEMACDRSIAVCKRNGVDLTPHRARVVTAEDLKKFDLIIALDSKNREDLIEMGAENLYKLGDFGFSGEDVPDPYYFNKEDGFDAVYSMVEKGVKTLLDEVD